MNSRVSSGVVGGSLDVADMMESTDGRSNDELRADNPFEMRNVSSRIDGAEVRLGGSF